MSDFFQSVPVSVLESFFKPDAAQLRKNLTRLRRTDALILCAKLNLLTSDAGSKSPAIGQATAIKLLQGDGILPTSWYNNLAKYLLGLGEPGYAINRPALLELMRWIVGCTTDTGSDKDFRENHVGKAFVSSLFMCSDFYAEREIAPTLKEEGDIKDRRFKFLPGLRRAAMWAGAFAEPRIALGRTQLVLIEHFFAENPDYRGVFEKVVGITIEDFQVCATAIVLTCFLNDVAKERLATLAGCFEISAKTLFANAPHFQPKFDLYLKHVAQTAEELSTALGGSQIADPGRKFNFRPFRNKPLLRFGDKIIVIDQRFFVESFSVGPLFTLNIALKSDEALKKYGVACQNYAFELLQRINGRHEATEQALAIINEPPGDRRPINDIVIRGGADCVVLFEAKGVWLNDNVLDDPDSMSFWKEVLKKYGVSIDQKTGKEKRKGTAQLADVLTGLENGQLHGIDSCKFINDATEFIPVLVMQDSLMSVGTLISNQLAVEFNKLMSQGKALPAAGKFQFGKFTVHSLVPVTLHDLEALETVKPTVSILDLFREYSQEVPQRGDTFTTFLNNRKPGLSRLPNDQLLLNQTTAKLFEQIQAEHFHKEP